MICLIIHFRTTESNRLLTHWILQRECDSHQKVCPVTVIRLRHGHGHRSKSLRHPVKKTNHNHRSGESQPTLHRTRMSQYIPYVENEGAFMTFPKRARANTLGMPPIKTAHWYNERASSMKILKSGLLVALP
jgi:hypothetical protein